jgi:formylglycine-generating enzyme required for sulfatase activity
VDFSPPERVDEYELLRPLGRGGMGTVYLARDTLLDRLVALKFIASQSPDGTMRQRFQNEGRALGRLSHPNVVTIHRVGEVDGRPYLVCELVEGETLAQLRPPVPAARVIAIAVGAARGLAAVHRHGLLHRDLKPANIAVLAGDQAKLLDFGLATLADERPVDPVGLDEWVLTAEGNAVGTRAFLAPEILDGQPATRQSDIYALGSVLYELSSGIRLAAQRQAPPPASDDAALAAIIARAVEPDVTRRYRSADDLRDALEQLMPSRREAPVPEGNPYRGLRPFEAEHRSLFFGRVAEARAVLDRLRSEPVVIVAGDSGVGKSSLCRAGVLPLILAGELDGRRVWRAVTWVPGRRPLQALARAIAPDVGLSEERCADLVRADPGALGRSLRRRLGEHNGLLFFVDQAEELVALADPLEAAQVAEALAALGPGPLRVLMAVRGDLFTRLAALPGLADALPGGLYLLRRLSTEQLREAIVGPALRVGVRFESETLVDALVESAADAPGGAALLSFALAELWELRDPERAVLSADALASVGGVAGALARHADGLLAGLPPEQREAVPRILTRLVTAEGTRARRTALEIGATGPGRAALEALVRGRLLVATEAAGETAYELAHEALLVGWGTLREWLGAGAAERVARERLAAATADWERLGHDRALLWNARRQVELERLDEADLTPSQTAFVRASRRAARLRRGTRIAAVVGAVLFAGTVVGGVRLQAHAALAAAVASRRAPAVATLEHVRDDVNAAARLRAAAEERFRAPGTNPASAAAAWQRAQADHDHARVLERASEDQLLTASQALEAALLLDPSDGDTRRDLAEVTALRLELSERGFERHEAGELAQRLRTYAPGSPLTAALDAPAELSIDSKPSGAAVSLERYVRDGGRMRLEPIAAGLTPMPARRLDAGSYRVTFALAGHAVVRAPIILGRGETLALALDLPPATAVPAGAIYVPPGRFLFGSADDEGMRHFLGAPPQHTVTTGAYLIGRNEVTFAEYLEFLRSLPPAERAAHLPRAESAIRGSLALDELPDGRFRLTLQPASTRYSAVEGEPIHYNGRERRAEADWRRFPVSAVSFHDALAYLAWLDHTGRFPGARFCSEHEWERAARGADDRVYPQGDHLDNPDWANIDVTYGRRPEAFGPDEVGAHPETESPFGVFDLVGNAWEWTSSLQEPGAPAVRGGSYYQGDLTNLSTNRDVGEPFARDLLVGMRVCANIPPRSPP